MRFLAVGCSYKTAAVDVRERLACAAEEVGAALGRLSARQDVEQALILSTCNRVEVWCVTGRPRHAAGDIAAFFAQRAGMAARELDSILYRRHDQEALDHIFRVTASLDAMVVGETQITSQVKSAYAAASRAGTVGPSLNRCMHRALGAAKRIRTETDIALHPVSVSSVAADLTSRVFGDLYQSTVLVVGAGEMAELAVRHLLSGGATDIRVLNRTLQRAQALAGQLQARAYPFEDLSQQLLKADIILTSTGSQETILSRDQIAVVMRRRKQRPLFIIDIAVPRDVERSVGSLPNVYLFDIDDLEQVVASNLKARRKEARHAEEILKKEVALFEDWVRTQDAVPVIKQLRSRFSSVARAEAARTAHVLNLEDERQVKALNAMADSIVNKLLHVPTIELKEHAHKSDGLFLSRTARHLFRLSSGEEERVLPEEDAEDKK